MCMLWKGRRSTCEDGLLRSVEVELFSQHGHHTRYLFLLAKTGVLWPGLEVGGHHVVDPCEDLHDLKLFAKLIKNVTEGLDKPGASARIPPRVVTCENKCVRMLHYCLTVCHMISQSGLYIWTGFLIHNLLIWNLTWFKSDSSGYLMSILLEYDIHSLSTSKTVNLVLYITKNINWKN